MSMITIKAGKFQLGTLVVTAGVSEAMSADGIFSTFVSESLQRHANCDWGDLEKCDKDENKLSLEKGFRLLSAYTPNTGKQRIWIITEHDRSVTTVLFPDEY